MTTTIPNVLLIHPKFRFDSHVKKQSLFPFGLGYIAACLQQAGYHVDVWDIYIEKIDYDGVRQKLQSGFLQPYSHIGITGIVTQYLYVKRLVEDIKKVSDAVVTVGGPLATYSSHLLLRQTPVDCCVLGYGEFTYVDVVSGKAFRDIQGIAFKTADGEIHTTPSRGIVKDLDTLPYPAYELFDMEFYLKHSLLMDILRPVYKWQKVMAIVTGRGCPYNCRFCSKSVRTVSYKSVDYLIEEMRHYQEQYGVRLFHFVDELVVISKSRILEFCQKVKALDVLWDAQGRVNLVDEETLSAMKDAGCICIGFGIESGSQTILEKMNKQITTDQIRRALTICRDIKLATKVQLIYGYPGENDDTLAETLQLFKELRYPARRFNVITPLPGSQLYEVAKTDGFIGGREADTISEVNYHEWLSYHPLCNEELFYNRTAFADEEFFTKKAHAERMFLVNFATALFFHPVDTLKRWHLYRLYLLNWWIKYQKKFRTLHRILFVLRQPVTALARVRAKLSLSVHKAGDK